MIENYLKLLFILLITAHSFPQQSTISKAVNYLSDFIASDYFVELKKDNSDIALVDSLYLRAVKFYENDYEEALLALTFTTIPYREVPIVLPVIKARIYYPLISASDSVADLKNQNLPSRLFFDSPDNSYGDRDKLAHFFGNAFIGYAENILNLADVFGYFVEAFEEDFKAQSEVDFRDIEVNRYGLLFGNLLEENKNILPGDVLIIRSLRFNIFVL